jgi:hypothetical protein
MRLTEDEWWAVLDNNWRWIMDAICASIDTYAYINHHGLQCNIDVYHQLLHAKTWYKVSPLLHFMAEASFGFPEDVPPEYENGVCMIELLLEEKDAILPDAKFIPEEGEEWKS